MQNFGTPPQKGQTYVRRPGVYAILPSGSGILATYQAGIHNEYQLPGGGIDSGESPVSALHREVLEETGWRISSPRFWFRFRRFTFMPEYDLWAEKICTIYVAKPVLKLGPPLEAEHTDVFLNTDFAKQNLAVDGDRYAVAKFLDTKL